jgi:hypothetical protein
VMTQVDQYLTKVNKFDQSLVLIKNIGRHRHATTGCGGGHMWSPGMWTELHHTGGGPLAVAGHKEWGGRGGWGGVGRYS